MVVSFVNRRQMRKMLDQKLGEVTVVCSDSTFRIHKKQLVACSDFFRAALDEKYLFQEAITSTVVLPEDDGETFQFLAFYAYTGSLLSYADTKELEQIDKKLVLSLQVPNDEGSEDEESETSTPLDPTLQSIILLSKAYYMADKCFITGLQTLCANEAVQLAQALADKSLDWLPAGSANLEALGCWIREVYTKTTQFDLALKESVCVYLHQASDRAATELFYPHVRFVFDMLLLQLPDLHASMMERAEPPPPTCPGCFSPAGCRHLSRLVPWYTGYVCECELCGLLHQHRTEKEEMEWQPGQWPRHERWRMLWDHIVANSNGVEELDRMAKYLKLYEG